MGHHDRGKSLKDEIRNPNKTNPKSRALNPKHKEITFLNSGIWICLELRYSDLGSLPRGSG